MLNPSTCNHYFDDSRKIKEPLAGSDSNPHHNALHRDHLTTVSEQTGYPKANTRESEATLRYSARRSRRPQQPLYSIRAIALAEEKGASVQSPHECF